ncbi:TetR/AcrR family transcriptional regulator [Nocardia sp. NBC_01730]|uniref:TetR/AcrR family transcriptional regulator n=1 Tax=Nocardia sp. NBC_01730 TaxID=2975998 RepID=UPI002E1327B9|nr:TetR/AcrR family transcriptional regulator [Nocardia sp. NBC_01730]
MTSRRQPAARRYDTLLAKGEERKLQILAVAQRLLVRKGWRSTSLALIATEAGVSQAGLLHHFESKEQLLHSILDARDADDAKHVDLSGDIIEQIERVADRFTRSPELIGMYIVLLTENLGPGDPLRDRLVGRHRIARDTVAAGIRRGQRMGKYRADINPTAKAVEIIAFLNGMETSWLLDPSIPLAVVFREYCRSLSRELTLAGTY